MEAATSSSSATASILRAPSQTQLIEIDDELGAALLPPYTQHRGVPSSSAVARRRLQLVGQAGRDAALSSEKPIHNFR
jgi:hypothetical protein